MSTNEITCKECGAVCVGLPIKAKWEFIRHVEDDDPDAPRLNGWCCESCAEPWRALEEAPPKEEMN